MHPSLERLSADQRAWLDDHLRGWRVCHDHSWGHIDTWVLEADSARGRVIIKAGGPTNHHLLRELDAHHRWTQVWTSLGRAPQLVAGSTELRILVTDYLEGVLVEGTPHQDDPGVFQQAGELLAQFHAQNSRVDPDWVERQRQRVRRYLGQPHRLAPGLAARIETEAATWPDRPVTVVPAHGDWQPRNWLIHGGEVRVIDFGRATMRPAAEDLVRLARQDFVRHPRLEEAFLNGYGADPREDGLWRVAQVGEAVGTAVWAHQIGDHAFEQVGHDHLARLYPSHP